MSSDPNDLWAELGELPADPPAQLSPMEPANVAPSEWHPDGQDADTSEPLIREKAPSALRPDLEPEPAAEPDPNDVVPDGSPIATLPVAAANAAAGKMRKPAVRWMAGAAVGTLLLGGVGWLLQKESVIAPHRTAVAEPTAAPVPEATRAEQPAAVVARVLAPPEPADDVMDSGTPAAAPVLAPESSAAEPPPSPAHAEPLAPKAVAKPKPTRQTPPTAAHPKPSKPAEPQWQDDAMDALDQLERQL